MSYEITIYQNGEETIISAEEGDNLLTLLQENNYEINSYCGGQGICGKCKIKVLSGEPAVLAGERELLNKSEIEDNIRLACLHKVSGNMKLKLENSEEIVALTGGEPEKKLSLKPLYNREKVSIPEPSLEDQRGYLERIHDLLSTGRTNYNSLKKLDDLDKVNDLNIVYKNDMIVDVISDTEDPGVYGVAIDIGTTTVVLYLIDLITGREIDVYSLYNPQKKYGADVISRINYCQKEENGKQKLQSALIEELNNALGILAGRNSLTVEQIYFSTVVGNTIMLHTLMGADTSSIARTPYIPLFTESLDLMPAEAGLNINGNGMVRLLPSISGYVGADIVGDLLSIYEQLAGNTNLLIDIGTNGEIVLNKDNSIYACSTAAGPAFEGANISFGMAGLPGAVDKFKINRNHKIEYSTIGDKKASGICGSGLVDIVAELYRTGVINERGSFNLSEGDEKAVSSQLSGRMTEYKDLSAFIVVPGSSTKSGEDIVITQKDIREVQLAKGAIQAGVEILKKEVEIDEHEIDNVFIAGGFGNYIDPHNACLIDLLPKKLENKIAQIGNAAGTGAKMCLINEDAITLTDKIKANTNYIELSSRKDFQNEFMNSMTF